MENGDLYPKGSPFIMRDFYVDDGLASAGLTEEAVQLARVAPELCAMGGLRLHKFVSNDRNRILVYFSVSLPSHSLSV